jgi:hypothetical protein
MIPQCNEASHNARHPDGQREETILMFERPHHEEAGTRRQAPPGIKKPFDWLVLDESSEKQCSRSNGQGDRNI